MRSSLAVLSNLISCVIFKHASFRLIKSSLSLRPGKGTLTELTIELFK